jgi:mannitol/fructose-specific phosphotransferase system IIA component (Ntr-type)
LVTAGARCASRSSWKESAAEPFAVANLELAQTMTTIAQYTSTSLIVPRLRSREPSAVIGELCAALHCGGRVKEPFPLFNAAISHESVSSTATSPGWALPHARLKGLAQLSFAVGRSAAPLVWFGDSETRVQLVFLFAVPEADCASYLTLISGLAKLSQNMTLAESLLQAPDSRAIFEILDQVPLPKPRPTPAGSRT